MDANEHEIAERDIEKEADEAVGAAKKNDHPALRAPLLEKEGNCDEVVDAA